MLLSITTGSFDTALGGNTLRLDTTGRFNTAVGAQALLNNNGSSNTAVGVNALVSNTAGFENTAVGQGALGGNQDGIRNTATGFQALLNTTVSNNTADGYQALFSDEDGPNNTATGWRALWRNTHGDGNVADGYGALFNNMTGRLNTAVGYLALLNNMSDANIALGQGAGINVVSGANNIEIGNDGKASDNQTIRIGNIQAKAFIAGIFGKTTGSGTTMPVIVDVNGQLGTTASSERFKTAVKPMDRTSEAVLALKPVTFHYKNDGKSTPQFGLIAEEVAKVNPDLVVHEASGEIFTVRYEAVNAMLLNEFLKEHRKVNRLEATATQQAKQIKALTAALKEQAAQIQKVSAQFEMNKPAPKVVSTNE